MSQDERRVEADLVGQVRREGEAVRDRAQRQLERLEVLTREARARADTDGEREAPEEGRWWRKFWS